MITVWFYENKIRSTLESIYDNILFFSFWSCCLPIFLAGERGFDKHPLWLL